MAKSEIYFKGDTLTLEGDGTRVCLWLDRPHMGNAINLGLIHDFKRAFDILEDQGEDGEPVLVIRGRGDDFCRGIDLMDFPKDKAPDIHGFNRWERQVLRLERLHKITIAALSGTCMGGGFQLALACDLRVATQNVQLSLPEVRQGFLPGMATWRLSKFIGLGRYRSLLATGKSLSATTAQNWGLLEHVGTDLDGLLKKMISEVTPAHPTAMALARRLALESYQFSYEDAIGHFLAAQHRAINAPNFLGESETASVEEED